MRQGLLNSDFSVSGFCGRSNNENMVRKYPIKPLKEGETLISFGTFKGRSVEYVNQFNHNYIIFIASMNKIKKMKFAHEAIEKAITLTTKEEREKQTSKNNHIDSCKKKIKWLLDFIIEFEKSHPEDIRSINFLRSINYQLLQQCKVDIITKKQLVVVGEIWERHYGNKKQLIKKLKPLWTRKYDKIEEVLSLNKE